MQSQTAEVTWKPGDIPVSTRFDDPYFSLENGLEETRYVFLRGNDLPARFQDGFHIAELGFGTGLNFLTTALAWRQGGHTGQLHFTSFEAFPMSCADMEKALGRFGHLEGLSQALLNVWTPACGEMQLADDISLTVVLGDARETLPAWSGCADAWFLDGFAPAKNPELWSEDLMTQVAAHTKSQGTAATYTAAGFVRRRIQAAGFDVERVPGYGRKRHMTIAKRTR